MKRTPNHAHRAFVAVLIAVGLWSHAGTAEPQSPAPSAGLDRASVVVLPVEVLSNEPRFQPLADAVYDAVISRVRNAAGLNVVDQSLVTPFAATYDDAADVGRQLGAAHIVKASVAPDARGYQVRYVLIHLESDGSELTASGSGIGSWTAEGGLATGPTRILDSMVESIEQRLEPERAEHVWRTRQQAARERFLDPTLDDKVRLKALMEYQPPTMGGSYPQTYADGGEAMLGEIAAAAVDLGTHSDNPTVRHGMWRSLIGVYDPAIVEPLLHALQNDPVDYVRVVAADALAHHLDQPRVRETLAEAAKYDTQASVRRAARLSGASHTERMGLLQTAIRDGSLSDRERYLALSKLWNFTRSGDLPIDDALARSLIGLSAATSDGRIDRLVWHMLGDSNSQIAITALMQALESTTSEQEKELLVGALADHLDLPDVRATVVRLSENDASPLVQAEAERILREID